MSEPTKEQPQITPFEFLQQFPEAPSLEQIDQWKQQAPGARLRIWHSSDGKRVYVLRAIGGQELVQLQASLPPNIPPEKVPAKSRSSWQSAAACGPARRLITSCPISR